MLRDGCRWTLSDHAARSARVDAAVAAQERAEARPQLAQVAEPVLRDLLHTVRRLIDDAELLHPMKLRDDGGAAVGEAAFLQRAHELAQGEGARFTGESLEQQDLAQPAALIAADLIEFGRAFGWRGDAISRVAPPVGIAGRSGTAADQHFESLELFADGRHRRPDAGRIVDAS